MDSIDFDNVKSEKAKALRRYNRFRRIGSFFRAAEICVALLFVFWTFTRLPFVVQISGAFLRRIAAVVSTPLFVFLLGNSIVVVLVTKSSDQTTAESARTEDQVYQAFVRSRPSDDDVDLTDEIVYHDKEMIVTDSNSNSNSNSVADEDIPQPQRVEIDSSGGRAKVYRRSKSDVCAKQSQDLVVRRSLKRSETEKCRQVVVKEEDDSNNYAQDNLSNEEFQKTIEAFIEKQLMFRRQESLAVVVHNKAAAP